MVKIQRTFQGLEAELRSTGAGRFSGAGFLMFWLVFWVVGEAFALGILGWGAWSLFTGQPPGAGHAPLETGPALFTGLFLLCWTAFWTFGGIMAWRELLRRLFGSDRLIARGDSLEVVHGYGLFSSRQTLPRDRLLRFYPPSPAGSGLAVETLDGVVPLARLGTPAQLAETAVAFNAEFKLSGKPSLDGNLPAGWRELTSPEGHPIYVQDPATRQRLAIVLWVLFAPFFVSTTYLFQAMLGRGSLGALAAILAAFTALLGWGAWRLGARREEWVPGRGRITLDLRRRGHRESLFTGDLLEIREDRDSDGDLGFKLVAVQSEARQQASLQTARKHEHVIASCSGDATELLSFGCLLARRCAIPLADRTTPAAKAEDLAVLQEKLAATGRLGRWAARLLGKLAPRPH